MERCVKGRSKWTPFISLQYIVAVFLLGIYAATLFLIWDQILPIIAAISLGFAGILIPIAAAKVRHSGVAGPIIISSLLGLLTFWGCLGVMILGEVFSMSLLVACVANALLIGSWIGGDITTSDGLPGYGLIALMGIVAVVFVFVVQVAAACGLGSWGWGLGILVGDVLIYKAGNVKPMSR